jgi:hypothetical protein
VPPVVQRKVDELARGTKQGDPSDAALTQKIDQFKRRAKIDGVLLRAARRNSGDKYAVDVGTRGRGRQIELYAWGSAMRCLLKSPRSGSQRMALPYLSWPVWICDSRSGAPTDAGPTYAAA